MPPNASDAEVEQQRDKRFNRRTVLQNGALAVGGLALGAVGTVAADDEPHQFSIDYTGLKRYSPCTDEMLKLTQGTQHYTKHETEDGDDGYHINLNSYWDPGPVAVGQETGIEWSGQNSKGFSFNVRPPFPQTVSFLSNTTLTTDDSAVNIKYQVRVQVTINANGEITEYQDQVEIKCVG